MSRLKITRTSNRNNKHLKSCSQQQNQKLSSSLHHQADEPLKIDQSQPHNVLSDSCMVL
ncbi:hypothetical protein PGT21_032449 [Puccinia graminis f. sp. tritici]|uniref:Uncharacterized protein n=1 Tax=Puccinia graminis f. sp. tritici TaxID=56615 RepID=A0A5B0NRU6_PUCGR|nr:hypothetical protein PGT21_032449 [Puccinia graminis f. sp. tritici]